MATITIQANNLKEAEGILSKVYKADTSSTFASGKNAVAGSTLTAKIESENKVVITSNYYVESSLKQMFDNE